jgi:hypothetical protein
MGVDCATTLFELDWVLAKHETFCKSFAQDQHSTAAAKEQDIHLSGSYSIAGESAGETGHYQAALRYLRREKELSGQNVSRGELYLAAALVALDQVEEGKQCLRKIYGRVVTNGQCRALHLAPRESQSPWPNSSLDTLAHTMDIPLKDRVSNHV